MGQCVLLSHTTRWGYTIYVIFIPYFIFSEPCVLIHILEKDKQEAQFFLIMYFN